MKVKVEVRGGEGRRGEEREAAGRMQPLSLWVVGSIPAVAFFFSLYFLIFCSLLSEL